MSNSRAVNGVPLLFPCYLKIEKLRRGSQFGNRTYQNEKGDAIMDNYEVVLEYFKNADKPVKAGDVVEATGLDKKEVDKIMAKLKKEGKIVSPKRCFWEAKK